MTPAPVPGAWGWPLRHGGRAATIGAGTRYTGTTSQLCGLFPFTVPAGADVHGVPIGRHQLTAEPVGLDPVHWLRTGLVTNTAVWVQGQPGIGKSAIIKRLLIGLVGFGLRALVPGDAKGEYTPLVTALGGTVYRIGRGHHTLNPLDPGPYRAALAAATGTRRHHLAETLRARRLALLDALISIIARHRPDPTSRRLLAATLDLTTDNSNGADGPALPDLLHVLTAAPAPLREITATANRDAYAALTRDLVNILGLLCDGPLRGLFDRPSTLAADRDSPALSLDISALDNDPDDVVAAAMLCSWAWAAALADTHPGPTVQVQDELWRALRAAPGLVENADRITRLGRHHGVVSLQITHSLDDLDALPTPEDRAKARGLVSRAGTLVLGGMPDRELDPLARIVSLTDKERALITSWAAPPTWQPGHTHPGRGKYLITSGQRIGLPVALTLTAAEAALYDTDTAFRPPA